MSGGVEFDEVTLLALELAARRAELPGSEFVDLLRRFARAVTREVEARLGTCPSCDGVASAVDGGESSAPSSGDAEKADGGAGQDSAPSTAEPARSQGGGADSVAQLPDEAAAAKPAEEPPAQCRRRGPKPRLSDEQCLMLHVEHENLCATTGSSRASGAWVERKVEDLGVSAATVYAGLVRGRKLAGRRLTAEQRAELVRQYRAIRPNGDFPPLGWHADRAAELGVSTEEVYDATRAAKIELDKLLKERKRAAAVLSTPAPRAERFKVRRVHGTYGGG